MNKNRIPYELFKQRFLEANLFDQTQIIQRAELLEQGPISILKDGEEILVDLDAFLHGDCDLFAVALAKRFNYRLACYYVGDWETAAFEYLVHAFCLDDQNREIDIRGRRMPSRFAGNTLGLLDDFEETMDEVYFLSFSLQDGIDYFMEHVGSSSYLDHELKTANQLIELFEEKYGPTD